MKQIVIAVLNASLLTALAAPCSLGADYEPFPLFSGQHGAGQIAFSGDGNSLGVFMQPDKELRIWNVATRQESAGIAVGEDVHMWAFAPDREIVAFAHQGDGTVSLWDVATGQEIAAKRRAGGTRDTAGCLAFSPKGESLVWEMDGNLQIWPLTEPGYDSETKELKLDGFGSVSFSPDGQTMVVGRTAKTRRRDRPRGEVQFWDVPTWTRRRSLTGYPRFPFVALSHDGSRLAIDCREFVDLIDVASERRIRVQVRQPPFDPPIEPYYVALSADGQVLATARWLRPPVVSLWDADTGEPIGTLPHPDTEGIHSMAFSPDNVHFATSIHGGLDVPGSGGVYLWKKIPKTPSTGSKSRGLSRD
ncbi:MAG: WD40 repeat domain-containing protein [Pirellulales bacterium]